MTSKIGLAWRAILSLVAYFAFATFSAAVNAASTVALGQAAVSQLEDSNWSYGFAMVAIRLLGGTWPITLIFLAVMAWIWWTPVTKFIAYNRGLAALAAVALVGGMSTPDAYAYYDKTDRAEWVNIEANQSAFLIPMVGANKTSQKQFGSVEYLAENKVPAKRIQIPHVIAANTALMSDYYVPAATLYIVDRTPYTREWVDAADRGTSTHKEGMRFESADSIDITTGISISASVTEENAAKFFYNFGTNAVAVSTKPEDVFASAKYARSLAEVMDTVVRGKVHQVLALEFAKRKFMTAISDKAAIMMEVERAVKAEFLDKGITIAFVGYAEGLTFDPAIQGALNNSVIISINYSVKDAALSLTEIDRKNAEISVIRAQAATMQKWNGQINFPFFIPDSLIQTVNGWFNRK